MAVAVRGDFACRPGLKLRPYRDLPQAVNVSASNEQRGQSELICEMTFLYSFQRESIRTSFSKFAGFLKVKLRQLRFYG